MARFIVVFISFVFMQVFTGQAMAQESLRTLTKMAREQVLDWRNSELGFDLNIPPGASAATLTLYAAPGQTLPAAGSMLVVSVNNQAGIVVSPRPEAFSARIDLPVSHLNAGRNHVRISFEGAREHSCPIAADGAWKLDLARSRFDLSISANIVSFEGLEDWLSAGAWSLSRASIAKNDLGENAYAAFGALITQGLAVRAGRVPKIVAADRIAGVDFASRLDATLSGPGIALRPGARPIVEFQGRSEDEILAMARLFSGRLIRLGGTRATPMVLAHAPLVRGTLALDGVKGALAQPTWNARPFSNTVRTPRFGQTRLVIAMERPQWVSPNSTVLIAVDGGKVFKKRLKDNLNHFIIPLDQSETGTNVVRSFSIARETQPATEATLCVEPRDGAPLRVLSASVESNGFAQVQGLSRFAIDGAPFTNNTGAGTGVVFATRTDEQTRAAWRAMARIAIVSGAPLTSAWYGVSEDQAPKTASLLVLGPRPHLTEQLTGRLPQVFAAGASTGPEGFDTKPKKRRIRLSRSAYAADADLPDGLGVAGWTHSDDRPALVLTGEASEDFIPAMHALADGPAVNFFSGTVVRWRAGRVEVSDSGVDAGPAPRPSFLTSLLFIIAGISLIGLWIRLWSRLYSNWQPA